MLKTNIKSLPIASLQTSQTRAVIWTNRCGWPTRAEVMLFARGGCSHSEGAATPGLMSRTFVCENRSDKRGDVTPIRKIASCNQASWKVIWHIIKWCRRVVSSVCVALKLAIAAQKGKGICADPCFHAGRRLNCWVSPWARSECARRLFFYLLVAFENVCWKLAIAHSDKR